jgi:hypothetical protein
MKYVFFWRGVSKDLCKGHFYRSLNKGPPFPPNSCVAIIKEKFTPEQAKKAQRGSRGIALLFL